MGPLIRVQPDATTKIETLGRAAQYDLCGEACGTEANRSRDAIGRWIYPAVMPDGTRVNLLKVRKAGILARHRHPQPVHGRHVAGVTERHILLALQNQIGGVFAQQSVSQRCLADLLDEFVIRAVQPD